MGLFDKIKNILFEDEDEVVGSIPVYSKEDLKVKETKKVNKEVHQEPVRRSSMNENMVDEVGSKNHFKNIKRDIDFSFDDEDDLADVFDKEIKNEVKKQVDEVVEPPAPKSVFQSFDEEEFDRLNARINQNEKKVRRDIPKPTVAETARKANNNFSPTAVKVDDKRKNLDRYKLDIHSHKGKKPFTPSPVISPVYGILDKNYTVDEIVDKKDGLKREKNNPIVYTPDIETKINTVQEEVFNDVDIDTVRKKAFGELEDNEEKALMEAKLRREKCLEMEEELPLVSKELQSDKGILDEELPVESSALKEEVSEVVDISEYDLDNDEEEEVEIVKKPRELDDIEKTSTLQILDDIERELNSIKPIHDEYKESSDVLQEEVEENDDSLEDDLFHLIDSMYEQGEEEEDDD